MIRKILLVDDDPIFRMALEKRLAAHRETFAVVTAANGFEAVKELEKFPFSLVVVDLIMPRMDGMSLIAHVRENYPDLPVIVISALAASEIEKKIKGGGILAFLRKPFRADDLVAAINSSLHQEADGGIVYDVSPTVFLQLMEMEAKTCTVRIFDKASGKGGIVFFIDGQLVEARVDKRQGIEAACEVFTWDAVTLVIHNGCPPRANVINSDLQPIIMKAAGMKDESDGFGADGEEDEEEEPFRNSVRNILMKTGGEDCLTAFSFDAKVGRAVDHLQHLGALADFGPFQVGSVAGGGKHDRVFLPGQPAPVFTLRAGLLRTQVMARLRNAWVSQEESGS